MPRKHYKWVKIRAGSYQYQCDGKVMARIFVSHYGIWYIHYITSIDAEWREGGVSPTLEQAKHSAVGFVRGW